VSIPPNLDLSGPESSYVVANTPMYLIRKIRNDDSVALVSRSLSPDQILDAYKEAVQQEPKTLRDFVVPHVCLVALSRSKTVEQLRASTRIKHRLEYKWLDFVQRYLLDTYQSVTTADFTVKPRLEVSGTGPFPIRPQTTTRTLILPD
jgi:hypothetical protein